MPTTNDSKQPVTKQDLSELQLKTLEAIGRQKETNGAFLHSKYAADVLVADGLATKRTAGFTTYYKLTKAGRDLLNPPKVKLSKAQIAFLQRMVDGWKIHQLTTWGDPYWSNPSGKIERLNVLTWRALKARKLIIYKEKHWHITDAGRAALGGE